MTIKHIYCLAGDPNRLMVETPDGKLYTFTASPYRVLTENDLTGVKSPLPAAMYIKTSHAFEPTESFSLAPYGLVKEG